MNEYIIFHVKTSIFVPKIYYQVRNNMKIMYDDYIYKYAAMEIQSGTTYFEVHNVPKRPAKLLNYVVLACLNEIQFNEHYYNIL